jgi:hypothetical protein
MTTYWETNSWQNCVLRAYGYGRRVASWLVLCVTCQSTVTQSSVGAALLELPLYASGRLFWSNRVPTVYGIVCACVWLCMHIHTYKQGDQKLSVHLMITAQKARRDIFNQLQLRPMITELQLRITDGVSVSLMSPWPWRSAAKQSDWAK